MLGAQGRESANNPVIHQSNNAVVRSVDADGGRGVLESSTEYTEDTEGGGQRIARIETNGCPV